MSKINIVIADDNRFFCEALKDHINNHEEFNVRTVFFDLDTLINYTQNNTLDLLILDVNFNGVSSIDYIDKIRPNPNDFKIILLTTLNNNLIQQEAKEKGVNQFVGKDSDLQNFKSVIIDTINSELPQDAIKRGSKILVNNILFTKRKIEILRALYIHTDKSEKEISKKLFISESALKTHKRELFELTNTNNTNELIKYGIQNGLIIP